MEIINKIVVFSYILFALSLMALYLNKVAAIIVLIASFGAFLLGGFLRAQNNSLNKNRKKNKGDV